MFQHNSYRVERYARWYRSNSNILRSALIAFLVALTFIPVYKWAVLTAIALTMFSEAWREFRTVYKKPIVYTMRVKRMLLTAGLLTACRAPSMDETTPSTQPSTSTTHSPTPSTHATTAPTIPTTIPVSTGPSDATEGTGGVNTMDPSGAIGNKNGRMPSGW
jgi:hypothetical protein